LGHRQAIIVGDVKECGTHASNAAGGLRACVRNLVVLPVPLASESRLAFEFFARTVVTDPAGFANLFVAVVDLSGSNAPTRRIASSTGSLSP
jgi:Mg-chelatase subunit ChlD